MVKMGSRLNLCLALNPAAAALRRRLSLQCRGAGGHPLTQPQSGSAPQVLPAQVSSANVLQTDQSNVKNKIEADAKRYA